MALTPAPITKAALADAAAYVGRQGFDLGRRGEVLRLAPRGADPELMDGDASYSPHIDTILRYLHARIGTAGRAAEVIACYVHARDPAAVKVLGRVDRVAMTRAEAQDVVLAGGAGWGVAEILSDGQMRRIPAMTAADLAAAAAEHDATRRPRATCPT